jgi:glycosyltransferase involved in cell wall biosynthesis
VAFLNVFSREASAARGLSVVRIISSLFDLSSPRTSNETMTRPTTRDQKPVRRTAVVYPKADLDSVPMLSGLIDFLASKGWAVDIFCTGEPGAVAPAFTGMIRRFVPPVASWQLTGHLRALAARLPLQRAATRLLARAEGEIASSQLPRMMERHKRMAGYDVIITVDPEGAIAARRFIGRTPLVYLSLELLSSADIPSRRFRRWKSIEQRVAQAADFIIIQDRRRAEWFAQENGLALDRCVLLPNAPREAAPARNRYWHEHFGLKAEQKVVLHAGSLHAWSGIEKIVAASRAWPEPWTLVVHSRDWTSSVMRQRMRALADPGKAFFSWEPAERGRYAQLVAAADVGVAFYHRKHGDPFGGENLRRVGLSSGKLAYFLQCGLPVITNSWSNLGSLVASADCGLVVEDAAEIASSLPRLLADYDGYSQRAKAAFKEWYNLEQKLAAVLARIEMIVAASAPH